MFIINCTLRRQIAGRVSMQSGRTRSGRAAGDRVHNSHTVGCKINSAAFHEGNQEFLLLRRAEWEFVRSKRRETEMFAILLGQHATSKVQK